MRIYTSADGGSYVNAISKTAAGVDVEGHLYQLVNGTSNQALSFQRGTVPEAGRNGTTTEAVLTAVVHRLKYLNGKFPCREDALAITKLEEALMWLDAPN